MKLKKIIYSIAAASMITPVAVGNFNQSTVQASAKGHAVSKKTAYKYTYKTLQRTGFGGSGLTRKQLKKFSESSIKKSYTVVNYSTGTQSYVIFHVSKHDSTIKVNTYGHSVNTPNGSIEKANKLFYSTFKLKRHYTFHE